MQQAATVPVAYLTAYYSLIVRGRLCAGKSLLIHSAAGAVGLAAINICMHRGVDVYVTVGTAEKRSYLLKKFPTLKESHIFSSRSCAFEPELMKMTNGRGVDALLNSTAGDILQASARYAT